ncbi:rRNA accumulation- protein [Malassezia nana]|uniref:rRNA accumulation- protein n=1 Tax=Malassezia nana TaxID=180528 RepID=A0AAF0J291_9BASI|nr:rRNA accumulation- protein [Malassezia nana]
MSSAAPEEGPTREQLQFARTVYILLEMWPALRQAVNEAWGGPESQEKKEFLLSHLCDEFGDGGARTKPDVDDVTELIEGYVTEEYACMLEDDSAHWVAMHICLAHTGIFEQGKGDEILAEYEASYARTGSHKPVVQMLEDIQELSDGEDDAPAPPQPPKAPVEKPAPEIDEDGFVTVPPRRRR